MGCFDGCSWSRNRERAVGHFPPRPRMVPRQRRRPTLRSRPGPAASGGSKSARRFVELEFVGCRGLRGGGVSHGGGAVAATRLLWHDHQQSPRERLVVRYSRHDSVSCLAHLGSSTQYEGAEQKVAQQGDAGHQRGPANATTGARVWHAAQEVGEQPWLAARRRT